MSIYEMLTYKMSIYKLVSSDDSMHTSSVPGRRAGSRCLVRERRDQPQTAHGLDEDEAVWLRALGSGPSLRFKAVEPNPKVH